MANGRVVQFFFVQGDPDGIVICDESNRTARVVRIPRAQLSEALKRDDLKDRVATYLLVAENQEEIERPYVYVGESEDVGKRFTEHVATFSTFAWTHAIVVMSQNEVLNKAHVKYMERQWYELLQLADRCVISQNVPQAAKLSEAERAILDDFSATSKFLINALGYSFFEKIVIKSVAPVANSIPRFKYLTHVKDGYLAFGKPAGEGFLVEKGSKVDPELKAGSSEYWRPVREQLVADRVIGHSSGQLQFLQDWVANSPSRAAAVVYGGSANGRVCWKAEQGGQTLADWQALNGA